MLNKKLNYSVALLFAVVLLLGCSQNSQETSEQDGLNSEPAQPSSTPIPTDTPAYTEIPVATDTPAPTETPQATDTPPPTETPEPTPMPEVNLAPDLPEGDTLRGRNAAVRYRCHGCHLDPGEYGPQFAAFEDLPHIMERGELRIAAPGYEGRAATNLEYIIESIFLPEIHLIEGEWEEAMPTTFLIRMTDQELANILAWMEAIENE